MGEIGRNWLAFWQHLAAKGGRRMKKQAKPIRAKWPRVTRVFSHKVERFMVDSRRVGFAQGGRTFFETAAEALAEAETLAREWHNEGANAFIELSAAERKDASKALAILAEAGYRSVSLID